MSLTRIPGNQVPVLEQNGLMSREWYRFFYNLFQLTGGGSTDITPAELQAEIDVLDTTVAGLSADVSTLDTQVGNIDTALTALTGEVAVVGEEASYAYFSPADNQGEIQKALQDVSLNQLTCCINDLNNTVQRLSLQPPVINNGDLGIGAFYDTTTQTAAAIDTAYTVTFNTVIVEKSVYRGSTTSQIYVTSPGWYDFQFSIQLDNTAGGNHLANIWARVNGSDIPYSASQVRLKGQDGELVAAWNFFVEMAAGDYFELVYSVSDTAIQIVAQAAASPVPAIPSVILTVNQVYSPYGH